MVPKLIKYAMSRVLKVRASDVYLYFEGLSSSLRIEAGDDVAKLHTSWCQK